ncbi:hypothetical protein [Desulfurobacterium sp.]
MGKIDEFVNEKFQEIEEKQREENKTIERYRQEAKNHLDKLNFYHKQKIRIIPFIKRNPVPAWFSYFKSYFETIYKNPRNIKIDDDFILRQLNSLKCSFNDILTSEIGKRFGALIIGIPLLFFTHYAIFSNMNTPLNVIIGKSILGSIGFIKQIIKSHIFSYPAKKLLIPLAFLDLSIFSDIKEDKYLINAFLLATILPALYLIQNPPAPLEIILNTWKNLEDVFKILFVEIFMFAYLISVSKAEARCKCIELIYSYVYTWAKRLKENN